MTRSTMKKMARAASIRASGMLSRMKGNKSGLKASARSAIVQSPIKRSKITVESATAPAPGALGEPETAIGVAAERRWQEIIDERTSEIREKSFFHSEMKLLQARDDLPFLRRNKIPKKLENDIQKKKRQ